MTVDVEERYLTAGTFRTRYLEAGSSELPTIVLLHDGTWGGASSVTWGNTIALIAESYHILAPDLIGFGGTDKAVYFDRAQYEARAAQVSAFLARIGETEPVHLVGNSFGGSLALRIIADGTKVPVRSVTSICGSGGPWKSDVSTAELSHWDGTKEDLRRIVELLIDADSSLFEEQLLERLRWGADVGHYRAVKAVSTPVPPAIPRPRVEDEWPAQLTRASVPVMLVAGRRDVLLQPDWTEKLKVGIRHARVELVDARHSPNIDQPQMLATLLLDFLRKL